MTTVNAIKVLGDFQKGIAPNTELDQAISVALTEMKNAVGRGNRPNGNGQNGQHGQNKQG